jgi:NAD(P)-dependent dehydrogenase (short-subunit alcohol dehydrogenase family)
MRIEGKAALVTGGASGLGRAAAVALHAAGARVLLLDLPTSQGEAVAGEIGEGAAFAAADVTSEADVTAAVERAVDLWGSLHITVNCAGIGWAGRTVSRGGPHDLGIFSKVIEVNAIGTFNVIRLATAQMGQQEPDGEERGVVVNTASIAAFDGQTGQAAYAASKGAVVSMTLPIARDLSARAIRCVTIAPGIFETPMLMQLPEPARKQLEEETPHPARLGRAEEYAALVRHIVENPMLNGEVIRLDGALRMPYFR